MKTKFSIIFTIILTALFSFACGKTEQQAENINKSPVTNGNISTPVSANLNAVNSVNSTRPQPVVVSLVTPKETFKSHYAALAANDEEALRKTLATGMIQLYSAMMPNKKIVEIMREMLKQQGETTDAPEVISEKINGSGAIVKWKAKDGTIVDQPLVKEGSDWKMTMGK